jgi:putative transposase
MAIAIGDFLPQPRKIEHAIDPSQHVIIRNELAERASDEQLKLIPFLPPQHVAPLHPRIAGNTESVFSNFFNDPIVHLIRHSLRFVAWQDRKRLMPALRAIYQAETADMAEQRLAEFEAEWGRKYPAIGPAWRRAWNEVVPFFAYPPQIRKMIYTTNAIESLHRGLRKIIKTRGAFPSDEAAMKLLYLALRNLGVHWRPAIEWRAAYAQFAIFFPDRVPTTTIR